MNIPSRSESLALAAALYRYNDTPQPDFCDLSPAQMHQLLYQPLGPASVVRLRADVPDDVLDQVPFLRLTEAFLCLLQRETPLRLTPLGPCRASTCANSTPTASFRKKGWKRVCLP